MTGEAVVGEDVTVPLSEIRTIEKVEISGSKTTIFGLSTAVVVVLVGGMIAAAVIFSQVDWSSDE